MTSVAAMASPSSVAQQRMSTSVQQPMTMATQQPGPSTSISVQGMAQQPLYTQMASNPFAYGMPSITTGATDNFFANNMVPSMPMSSGVPLNNFGPSQFRTSHIPLSNPTLGSVFAQTRAQVASNTMLGGGFVPQYFGPYGSAATTGLNYIHQTSNPIGNPSVLGGQVFGHNPYYGSSPQSQFQSFYGGNILGINVFGGDLVLINSNKIGTWSHLQKFHSWPL